MRVKNIGDLDSVSKFVMDMCLYVRTLCVFVCRSYV